MPAALLLPRTPALAAVGGTVWHGQALLADGETLQWRWSPMRSLAGFGFAADWTIAGPQSDLAGRALLRPGGIGLEQVNGRATGALLAVAMPDLGFVCGMPLRIVADGVALPAAARPVADIRSAPGLCAPKAGAGATLVPPLHLTLTPAGSGSAIALAPIGEGQGLLADGLLTQDGRLRLRITPAGARTLPFLGIAGGATIETTL